LTGPAANGPGPLTGPKGADRARLSGRCGRVSRRPAKPRRPPAR